MRSVAPSQKAVFLDRDGTINIDPGYINNPDDVILYPFAGVALKRLKDAGFLLVLVSNQSGVNRKIITPEQMVAVHERFCHLLDREGVALDGCKFCHHRPDEMCDCRKPKPKLLVDAAKELDIDLGQSFMVGDKISDVECGLNAGVRRAILVKTGNGRNEEPRLQKLTGQGRVGLAQDLTQAVDLILTENAPPSPKV